MPLSGEAPPGRFFSEHKERLVAQLSDVMVAVEATTGARPY
jgi:hypothetical protein